MILIYHQDLLMNLPKDLIDFNDSTYFKNNDFINEFSQIRNINSDYLSPGRKRLLSKKNINEENWDFNQEYQGKDLDSIERS